jgi:hypothetical protein
MSTILGVLRGTCSSPTGSLFPGTGYARPSCAIFPPRPPYSREPSSGSVAAYDAFTDHDNQVVLYSTQMVVQRSALARERVY